MNFLTPLPNHRLFFLNAHKPEINTTTNNKKLHLPAQQNSFTAGQKIKRRYDPSVGALTRRGPGTIEEVPALQVLQV